MDDEEVWIQKPLDLLRRIVLLPSKTDSFDERFNSLTRLLIVICVVLAIFKWRYWYVILIVGILILIHSYLSITNEKRIETEMKTFEKNNIVTKRMTERPAASYYTVERIVDDSRGVSLRRVANSPKEPEKGETITIIPKVMMQGSRGKKSKVMMTPKEPQIKLKNKNGAKINAPPKQKDAKAQPDFMRLAFEELEDGAIADQDSKNMDSLLL